MERQRHTPGPDLVHPLCSPRSGIQPFHGEVANGIAKINPDISTLWHIDGVFLPRIREAMPGRSQFIPFLVTYFVAGPMCFREITTLSIYR